MGKDNAKRAARMARIDAMPRDIRECVHEYGLTIVDALMQSGVTKARNIHHIVSTIRGGSYQSKRDLARIKHPEDSDG